MIKKKHTFSVCAILSLICCFLGVTILIGYKLISFNDKRLKTHIFPTGDTYKFYSKENLGIMENCERFEFIRPDDDSKNILKYQVKQVFNNKEAEILSYQDVMSKLKSNAEFRSSYFDILSLGLNKNLSNTKESLPCFFEVRPITKNIYALTPFEFVLIPAPSLDGSKADIRDFKEYFNDCDKEVVTFPNLGGDAHLVVPCPLYTNEPNSLKDINCYRHLAAFMFENKNISQLHNFWIKVAETLEDKIYKLKENQPIWLSTDGTGVYWLHVRLDSRPRYYSYQKYRKHI